MSEHENIRVLCLTCGLTFMTSRDSYDDEETTCPACHEHSVSEQPLV